MVKKIRLKGNITFRESKGEGRERPSFQRTPRLQQLKEDLTLGEGEGRSVQVQKDIRTGKKKGLPILILTELKNGEGSLRISGGGGVDRKRGTY